MKLEISRSRHHPRGNCSIKQREKEKKKKKKNGDGGRFPLVTYRRRKIKSYRAARSLGESRYSYLTRCFESMTPGNVNEVCTRWRVCMCVRV